MGGSGMVIFTTVTAKIDSKFLRQIASFAGQDCSIVDHILCGSVGVGGLSCRNSADGAWYVTGSLDSINKAHSHLSALYTLSQPTTTSLWDGNVIDLSPSMSIISPLPPGLLSPAGPPSPPCGGDPNTPQGVGYFVDSPVDLRLTPRHGGEASAASSSSPVVMSDDTETTEGTTPTTTPTMKDMFSGEGLQQLTKSGKHRPKATATSSAATTSHLRGNGTVRRSRKSQNVKKSVTFVNVEKLAETSDTDRDVEFDLPAAGDSTDTNLDVSDKGHRDAVVENSAHDAGMDGQDFICRPSDGMQRLVRKSKLVDEMLKERLPKTQPDSELRQQSSRPCRKSCMLKVQMSSNHGNGNNIVQQKRHNECFICRKRYTCRSNLNRHIKVEHRGRRFACDQCNTSFTTKNTLLQHAMSVHAPFYCKKCCSSFDSERAKSAHVCPGALQRTLVCEQCSKSFVGASNLYRHVRTAHKNHRTACYLCSREFRHSDSMKVHVWRTHKRFECFRCYSVLPSPSDLMTHMTSVHGKIASWARHELLRMTSKTAADASRVVKRRRQAAQGGTRSRCEHCGQQFSTSSNRKRHILVVHKNHRYLCPVCERPLSTKERFYCHIAVMHGFASYKCSLCDSMFAKHRDLSIHMQSSHSRMDAVSTIQCELCGLAFLHHNSLMRHKQTLHGIGRKFQCTNCEQGFARKDYMLEHVRLEHDSSPFRCSVCLTAFRTASKCREHEIAVHTNLKPHMCTYCSKRFARRSALSLHLRRVHHVTCNVAGVATATRPDNNITTATVATTADSDLVSMPTASFISATETANCSLDVGSFPSNCGTEPLSLGQMTLGFSNPQSGDLSTPGRPSLDIPDANSPPGILANVTIDDEDEELNGSDSNSRGFPLNDSNNNSGDFPQIESIEPTYISMPVFFSVDSPVLWNLQPYAGNSPSSLV